MLGPAFTLANRAALRRAFYRLTGTSATDDQLSEHDTESNETVHYYLHRGLWSAQEYLVTVGGWSRWVTRVALGAWSTDGEGRRYVALPDDFLRLAGDERESALLEDGRAWGSLIPGPDSDHSPYVAGYWIEGDRLYAGRTASVPAGLTLKYIARHPVITSDDETTPAGAIDFPLVERPLIVAFAAYHFSRDPSFLGDRDAMQVELATAKAEAARRSRTSREPNKLRPPPGLGTHWF